MDFDLFMYREELLNAIEKKAGCAAVYIQTQPVKLSVDGNVVWKGKVDVFELKGHPQAKNAFGWALENEGDKKEYITVIGIPPLDNAVSAAKAYVASRDNIFRK